MNITALNQRIKRSGIKKQFIARKVGIHYTHLSRILNGVTKKPNPDIIKKIKKVISKTDGKVS